MTFLIKKRNAFTQLSFPNIKTSEVFYFHPIIKQTNSGASEALAVVDFRNTGVR